MDALVIGGGGFVGGYLLRQLQSEGKRAAATRLPHEQISVEGCGVYDLDVGDEAAIRELLSGERPMQIYHLAAQSSVGLSWDKPEQTVDVNIKGALHLLEAVRSIPDYRPRILLIGSGEEYGFRQGDAPISEEEALHPGNIYAVTKACQNMLGGVYARAYGMDIVMVRAFNHIGAGQSAQFVAADFAGQIAEIEAELRPPVMKVGNLTAKRDFSDVRDVVRAYTLLMEKGRSGETYNVGSGAAIAVQTLLDTLLSMSHKQIKVEQDADRMRPSDVPVIEADITKLRTDTGWQPEYTLADSLQAMLNHSRQTIA